MQLLTTQQKQELVQIITEEFGSGLASDDFTESLLALLEDVSGFESAPPAALTKITQQLWSQYHD